MPAPQEPVPAVAVEPADLAVPAVVEEAPAADEEAEPEQPNELAEVAVDAPVSPAEPVEPQPAEIATHEFQTPLSPGSENVSYASKEVQGSAQKTAELDEIAPGSAMEDSVAEDGEHADNRGALKWVKSMFSKKVRGYFGGRVFAFWQGQAAVAHSCV